jgi:hypothetical protein
MLPAIPKIAVFSAARAGTGNPASPVLAPATRFQKLAAHQ